MPRFVSIKYNEKFSINIKYYAMLLCYLSQLWRKILKLLLLNFKIFLTINACNKIWLFFGGT